MIFVGDIASPNEFASTCLNKVFKKHPDIFFDNRIICNFEGLIYDRVKPSFNEPILYNHSSVLKVLKSRIPPAFCLANNHILDLPGQFEPTLRRLNAECILYCGAGRSRKEAEQPVVFSEDDRTMALFNVCWDFLLYNHKNPSSGIYIAELNEISLIQKVRAFKTISPESLVLVYVHWNLDLETLPFPMYRRFSRDLIDAGASIVVGSHSHCVQGGEKYRDGYIIYGLGNLFIPSNKFVNGRLIYPEVTSVELAFEWDPDSNNAKCHWFRYQHNAGQNNLLHLGSEKFEDSEILARYSPFQGMSDNEYLKFFKLNRRKKILIPVYQDYHFYKINSINTMILKNRARFARILARRNLIRW